MPFTFSQSVRGQTNRTLVSTHYPRLSPEGFVTLRLPKVAFSQHASAEVSLPIQQGEAASFYSFVERAWLATDPTPLRYTRFATRLLNIVETLIVFRDPKSTWSTLSLRTVNLITHLFGDENLVRILRIINSFFSKLKKLNLPWFHKKTTETGVAASDSEFSEQKRDGFFGRMGDAMGNLMWITNYSMWHESLRYIIAHLAVVACLDLDVLLKDFTFLNLIDNNVIASIKNQSKMVTVDRLMTSLQDFCYGVDDWINAGSKNDNFYLSLGSAHGWAKQVEDLESKLGKRSKIAKSGFITYKEFNKKVMLLKKRSAAYIGTQYNSPIVTVAMRRLDNIKKAQVLMNHPDNSKPFVIALTGLAGTGKSFVARMISRFYLRQSPEFASLTDEELDTMMYSTETAHKWMFEGYNPEQHYTYFADEVGAVVNQNSPPHPAIMAIMEHGNHQTEQAAVEKKGCTPFYSKLIILASTSKNFGLEEDVKLHGIQSSEAWFRRINLHIHTDGLRQEFRVPGMMTIDENAPKTLNTADWNIMTVAHQTSGAARADYQYNQRGETETVHFTGVMDEFLRRLKKHQNKQTRSQEVASESFETYACKNSENTYTCDCCERCAICYKTDACKTIAECGPTCLWAEEPELAEDPAVDAEAASLYSDFKDKFFQSFVRNFFPINNPQFLGCMVFSVPMALVFLCSYMPPLFFATSATMSIMGLSNPGFVDDVAQRTFHDIFTSCLDAVLEYYGTLAFKLTGTRPVLSSGLGMWCQRGLTVSISIFLACYMSSFSIAAYWAFVGWMNFGEPFSVSWGVFSFIIYGLINFRGLLKRMKILGHEGNEYIHSQRMRAMGINPQNFHTGLAVIMTFFTLYKGKSKYDEYMNPERPMVEILKTCLVKDCHQHDVPISEGAFITWVREHKLMDRYHEWSKMTPEEREAVGIPNDGREFVFYLGDQVSKHQAEAASYVGGVNFTLPSIDVRANRSFWGGKSEVVVYQKCQCPLENLLNRIRANMARLEVRTPEARSGVGGCFLYSNVVLTVNHAVHMLSEKDTTLAIKTKQNGCAILSQPPVAFSVEEESAFADRSIRSGSDLIQISTGGVQFRDISKYIVTSCTAVTFNCHIVYTDKDMNIHVLEGTAKHSFLEVNHIGESLYTEKVYQFCPKQAGFEGFQGICGGLMVAHTASQCGIVGVLAAINDKKDVFALPLNAAMVKKEKFKGIPASHPEKLRQTSPFPVPLEDPFSSDKSHAHHALLQGKVAEMFGNNEIVGFDPTPQHTGSSRVKFYGWEEEIFQIFPEFRHNYTIPVFRGTRIDGEYYHPGKHAIQDLNGNADSPYIPYADAARNFLSSKMESLGFVWDLYRFPSFEDGDFSVAFSGLPGSFIHQGVKRTTSAGYPWKGKKSDWFIYNEDETFQLKPEVITALRDILNLLATGERQGYVTRGVYKDEPRAVNKVKIRKIRLFNPPEFPWYLLQALILGPLVQIYTMCRKEMMTFGGMSCFSDEWGSFRDSLEPTYCFIVAYDFVKFDKRLFFRVLWDSHLLDAENIRRSQWYKTLEPGEQRSADTILNTMASEMCSTYLNVDGLWMLLTGGNGSGSGDTYWRNCICHWLIAQQCFLIIVYEVSQHGINSPFLAESVDRFEASLLAMRLRALPLAERPAAIEKYIVVGKHGDDGGCPVTKEGVSLFNFESIRLAAQQLGMEITKPDKSGGSYSHMSWDDFDIGKRKFKWDPVFERWLAPLDPTSIGKMLTIGLVEGMTIEEKRESAVQDAALEMTQYGEAEYLRFQERIRPLLEKWGVKYQFREWREVIEKMRTVQHYRVLSKDTTHAQLLRQSLQDLLGQGPWEVSVIENTAPLARD